MNYIKSQQKLTTSFPDFSISGQSDFSLTSASNMPNIKNLKQLVQL